jgi:single-stranded-DNA-specific exonuclease
MTVDELISILLKHRGLSDPASAAAFFSPPAPVDIPLSSLDLARDDMDRAVGLVKKHLAAGHPVAVYGDYDVDGICSAAIVWETLYALSPAVFPHIPHRRDEGYGLSLKGIDYCLEKGARLIICVDNGIVAHDEVDYCRKKACDVLVIDHHQAGEKKIGANAVLHTTVTSAAGIAWFFAREFAPADKLTDLLSLAAVSVICDLVPLMGVNRSLAKYGLAALNSTSRPGLLALFAEAGLTPGNIGVYEVGFAVGPRLNAMGRLEHALDSLRLICTRDPEKARDLAQKLGDTNRLRQEMTAKSTDHALAFFAAADLPEFLFVSDPSYDEGIIGLVASKLAEKYYRPAVAVSVGREFSKASARSIPGFHITDFLRRFDDILTSVGGHSMAAGFTLKTADLELLKDRLLLESKNVIDPGILVKNSRIDAEVPLDVLGLDLYMKLADFAPFGLGNPRPVFKSTVPVYSPRRLGRENKHLKFGTGHFEAIYFNAPAGAETGLQTADIAYSLESNTYAGRTALQLVVKELKSPHI